MVRQRLNSGDYDTNFVRGPKSSLSFAGPFLHNSGDRFLQSNPLCSLVSMSRSSPIRPTHSTLNKESDWSYLSAIVLKWFCLPPTVVQYVETSQYNWPLKKGERAVLPLLQNFHCRICNISSRSKRRFPQSAGRWASRREWRWHYKGGHPPHSNFPSRCFLLPLRNHTPNFHERESGH